MFTSMYRQIADSFISLGSLRFLRSDVPVKTYNHYKGIQLAPIKKPKLQAKVYVDVLGKEPVQLGSKGIELDPKNTLDALIIKMSKQSPEELDKLIISMTITYEEQLYLVLNKGK